MIFARRFALVRFACALLVVGVPAISPAQVDAVQARRATVRWSILDALGYGGLGFGAGILGAVATQGDCGFGPCDHQVAVIAAATVAGMATGFIIGRRAETRLSRGESLTSRHRNAVIAGALLAGPVIGAVAASLLINSEGSGTALGSDEQTFAIALLASTALSSWYVSRHSRELLTRRTRVTPVVMPNGRFGATVNLRF